MLAQLTNQTDFLLLHVSPHPIHAVVMAQSCSLCSMYKIYNLQSLIFGEIKNRPGGNT